MMFGLGRCAARAAIAGFLFATVARTDDLRAVAPAGAQVAIVSPAEGATLKSPITVRFVMTGMDPPSADSTPGARTLIHLVVDGPLPDSVASIADDGQLHQFGVGRSDMTLALDAGVHTLQLVANDANHVPHQPPLASDPVSLTVTNLEVRKRGGEESNRYELGSDVPIRIEIRPDPLEGGEERRRAWLEEQARKKLFLEVLADEIRRAKRERAADQRQSLTLEAEEPAAP